MKPLDRSTRSLFIISEHFWPSTGATAQLVRDLAWGLSERDVEITVITSTHADKLLPDDKIRIVRLGLGSQTSVNIFSKGISGIYFSLSAFVWLCLNTRAVTQLLIVSNPPFIVLVGLIYHLFTGTPYYYLLQDLFPRSAQLTGVLPSKGPVIAVWRYLIQQSCAFSNSTIVLSEAMLCRACSDYHLRKEKIKVIHNWAVEQATTLHKRDNPLAVEWGIDSTFTIQYSGNFGRLHDILTILEAARLLIDYPIHFLFIGGGAKYEQIHAYKQHLNLSNITIRPYQPRHLLRQSLAACDIAAVALIPGSEDTVAPSKLYGILASAKPVVLIANKSTPIASQILKARCGIVASSGDSLSLASSLYELSVSPQTVEKMSVNSLSLYNRSYSKEASINRYYDLLFRDQT